MQKQFKSNMAHFIEEYGMILVLLILAVFFSVVTIDHHELSGVDAGADLAAKINSDSAHVLILSSNNESEVEMAGELERLLKKRAQAGVYLAKGGPRDIASVINDLENKGQKIDILACSSALANWDLVSEAHVSFENCRSAKVISPASGMWPSFLMVDNLRNIADQISIIAILAIGMTMVIMTGGIDLSVGSLIAFSSVCCTLLIREFAGGFQAGSVGVFLCVLIGIGSCALLGLFSGTLVAIFKITPFIATLAMMLVTKGLSFKLANSETISDVPALFSFLGVGQVMGVPVSVWLMFLLYALAYFVMHWTAMGRYIYAIGGNQEAARLSGVPVTKMLLWVYLLCGLLAGVGGVIMASRLGGGAGTYGNLYELYTIAAVVVGGTSLMGGQGKILGTLIGAFIIAVIQNGMNLIGIEANTQNIVLGLVIMGALLIDKYKRGEIQLKALAALIVVIALFSFPIYGLMNYAYSK